MKELLMLIEKTNLVHFKAIEHDYQTLQDQYQAIQTECLVLRKHYQILYEQHQALLERCRTKLGQHPRTATSGQALKDDCKSQQEQQRLIQQFRRTLRKHLLIIRSYRSNQIRRIQAGRTLVRKTILLGEGNEKDADYLKESMQQAGSHRVFLAADSTQVLCLVQNVHIDLLVLDNGLTPLPGLELYNQLHLIKGLEALPAIILGECFSSFSQAEIAHFHLIGLDKPIKEEALVRAIDQLLV
jgi:PleD family two-component response regulator